MRRLYYEAENEFGETIDTTDWEVTKEFNNYNWRTKLYTIVKHDKEVDEWNAKRAEKIKEKFWEKA